MDEQEKMAEGVQEVVQDSGVPDLDALGQAVGQVSEKVDGVSSTLTSGQELLSQKLDLTQAGVNDVLETVRSAGDTVDYTTKLDQLGQLLAVTDLVLVVLCVVAFLAAGLYIGHLVTGKLYANRG